VYEQRAKILFELSRAQASPCTLQCRSLQRYGNCTCTGLAKRNLVHACILIIEQMRVMLGAAFQPSMGRLSCLVLLSPSSQARAAATAGTASEVTGIAQLAQREVAMLQAQLMDLDKRNKLAVRPMFMPLACCCALSPAR
jgi:hypothetical protein